MRDRVNHSTRRTDNVFILDSYWENLSWDWVDRYCVYVGWDWVPDYCVLVLRLGNSVMTTRYWDWVPHLDWDWVPHLDWDWVPHLDWDWVPHLDWDWVCGIRLNTWAWEWVAGYRLVIWHEIPCLVKGAWSRLDNHIADYLYLLVGISCMHILLHE